MSAAENKRSIILGIFVFLGIVIFIAGVLTLGNKQKTFVKNIKIKAIFDDVGGLKLGNNVWFSGVKIGTVKAIDFYGNSQVEITMSIEEEAQKYIRKDAMAKVSSEGFIGNRIILIEGGKPSSPQVENGDELKVETSLSTDAIMATFQENNKNLIGITSNFKILSDQLVQGKGTVGALLADSLMANNIRLTIASLHTASSNAARISATISQFSEKLNNKDGLANQILTDTSVFRSLQASVKQLQQTTQSASQITDNLSKASSKLNSSNNAVGTLLNDEATAERLKNTIKNLETSTQKLDENMEALQHNFLLRGFFRKKAKAEAAK